MNKEIIPIWPPEKANSMQHFIVPDFNQFQYTIVPLEARFQIINITSSLNSTRPIATKYLRPHDSKCYMEAGYSIYDIYSPAPSISTNHFDIFGQLFGIEFVCEDPRTKKPATFIRLISAYEYLSCFWYHNVFVKKIQKYKECINLCAYMLPHRTLSNILISTHENQEDLQVQTQQPSKSPLSTLFKNPKSESSATTLNGIVFNSLPSESIKLTVMSFNSVICA